MDPDPSISGTIGITYATSGTSPHRRFTATWCHVMMYNGSYCNGQWTTTQIILYEGCNYIDVEVTHKSICTAWNDPLYSAPYNGGRAIIGVEDPTGSYATVASGKDYPNAYTCTNEAWRFIPTSSTSYSVSSATYSPVPNSTAVNWYTGASGGTLVGSGPNYSCATFGSTYRAEVTGCGGAVSTSVINVPFPSGSTSTSIDVCAGSSMVIPSVPTGGAWTGGPPTIATIDPATNVVSGLSPGVAVYIYNYNGGGCTYVVTINVKLCCNDTCDWTVNGNNIYGGRNIFGTLTNDDIRIVSSNTDRAVVKAGGNIGIRQLVPSTTLDVDCIPLTAPSGLQFEHLPPGHGFNLVVDPAGYVYFDNTSMAPPAISQHEGGTDLETRINELTQQVNDLRAQLNMTGVIGENNPGNSLVATPNPTSGLINVNYTIAGTFSSAIIKVTDNQGRTIVSKQVADNAGTIAINLPTGNASGDLIIALVVDGKLVARQKEVLVK